MKDPAKNMNIFEDLIDELKEENLIEETVVKTAKAKKSQPDGELTATLAGNIEPQQETSPNEAHSALEGNEESPIFEAAELMAEPLEAEVVELSAESLEAEIVELPREEIAAEPDSEILETQPVAPAPTTEKKENPEEIEFYRKRAMEEVSFLQMVESAFAGVERDQLKVVPTLFDDLEVKKVLHTYLQILPKATQSERSQVEFQLMTATENWYSTLAGRDKRIMAAHLRRYCETSRPPLSMPALIALARFYRNAPYSEVVRGKFDLMLTRIFSREDYSGERILSFERHELIGHIKDLYAEWSSVPLYSTDEDDEGILQTVNQFDDFVKEARAVGNFDALINGNFFNRLRQFKESTNEDFYAPPVAAAAIEMNVHIGNRYIELLESEKARDGVEAVENRYGLINDNTISETMSKTMSLVELLAQKQMPPEPEEEPEIYFESPPPPPVQIVKTPEEKAIEKNTNYAKWVFMGLGGLFLIVIVYFSFAFFSPVEEISTAAPLNIENSTLKNYLQEAWIEDGTLRGLVLPEWSKMTSEDRKQALHTMLTFGNEKGYHRIELINNKNQKIGIADDGGVFVVQ